MAPQFNGYLPVPNGTCPNKLVQASVRAGNGSFLECGKKMAPQFKGQNGSFLNFRSRFESWWGYSETSKAIVKQKVAMAFCILGVGRGVGKSWFEEYSIQGISSIPAPGTIRSISLCMSNKYRGFFLIVVPVVVLSFCTWIGQADGVDHPRPIGITNCR